MANLLKLAGRLTLGALALIAGAVAVSAAASALERSEPRGRLIDVGDGRRMRLVCQGPAPGPATVWFESGAFGFAADWGSVQSRLAAGGVRSCAYDRAGLGYSDPGPSPRDSTAIAMDLERLIAASGEGERFVFVGHSAAGLYLRRFAALHPERIAGLVLVDAMTPEGAQAPQMRGFVSSFRALSRLAAVGASVGVLKPLTWTSVPDRIGLVGPARAEKRRVFVSGRHNRGAAAEVRAWPASIATGAAQPPYDPAWPVAVVLAGSAGDRPEFNRMRTAPARAARRGRVEYVAGASHASLLGERFADRIVAAIAYVADNG